MPEFSTAGEGILDLAVARALLEATGHTVYREFDRRGKNNLDTALNGMASASQHFNWLILRDLDAEACAPAVLARILPQHADPGRFVLRLAKESIEAWLLADPQALSQFLSVRPALIPDNPEALHHPKTSLVGLAAQSRSRELREALVPRPASGARVGPEYNQRLIEFVYTAWNVRRAAVNCDSLARAVQRLDGFH